MHYTVQQKAFRAAFHSFPPDYVRMRELVQGGLDLNAVMDDRYSDYDDTFIGKLMCEVSQDEVYALPKLIQELITMGWHTAEYWGDAIFYLLDPAMGQDYLLWQCASLILDNGFSRNEKVNQKQLNSIGNEESYQRSCVHDHSVESVLFVIYEVAAARIRRHSSFITDTYHAGIGKRIKRLLLLDCEETIKAEDDRYRMEGDLAIELEEGYLNINVNVQAFFMNKLEAELPVYDAGKAMNLAITGKRISSIHFSDRDPERENPYAQPMLDIWLDDGSRIHVTNNVGLTEEPYQAYFGVVDGSK